ncbi:MAG: 50S ribosomal protein L25 [Patescibacteria group bacterium]|nr:50S ribosomal protein L25 [Patescibacteria group bacterium]
MAHTLQVTERDISVKGKHLLAKLQIPAVVYGQGIENKNVQMDYVTFEKLYAQAGRSSVVTLSLGKEKLSVLIHDYQLDPIRDTFRHVDFLVVNMKETVHAHIPLKVEGTPIAVRDKAGVIVHGIEEVEVKSLPGDLPHDISVDISALADYHDHINVSDLDLGDKVEIITDPATMIVSIAAPKKQEEESELSPAQQEAAAAEAANKEEA